MSAALAELSPDARERLRAYHQRRLADHEAKLTLAEIALVDADASVALEAAGQHHQAENLDRGTEGRAD